MEFSGYEQQGFLEELLATAVPMATMTNDDFCNNIINGWNQLDYWADSSVAEVIPQHDQSSSCFDQGCSNFLLDGHHQSGLMNSSTSSSFNELLLCSSSFGSDDLLLLSPPPAAPVPAELDTPPFLPSREEDNYLSNLDETRFPCKMEPTTTHHHQSAAAFSSIGGGGYGDGDSVDVVLSERRNKSKKKLNGQPSKNLMAERRRRKRLNDRLSMLRSVVPKISKMDRTSILGDTIDYMKELLERINHLQEESSNQPSLMGIFKDSKPNEALVRNSPKFDVERRNSDTRIEICCAGKTGLLLSTLTTLEALGLEIQHCVISCFNDFSVQASCSEEMEQREFLSSEEIKQALFRNAGYGGRCL